MRTHPSIPPLCRDMPKTQFSRTTSVKKKDASESGMGAALRWPSAQADGWCESGLCRNGKCQGALSNVHVKVVSDTADACGIEFSADIACECPPVAVVPTPEPTEPT